MRDPLSRTRRSTLENGFQASYPLSDIGHRAKEAPVIPHDATELTKCRQGIAQVLEYAGSNDYVKTTICEREPRRSGVQVDPTNSRWRFAAYLPCHSEHARRNVASDYGISNTVESACDVATTAAVI